MTEAPKHIWCMPGMPGYITDGPNDGVYDVQYTLTDQADLAERDAYARCVADARKVDVAKLRAAINRESGGYWVPTDEMLRRILSALTDPMQETHNAET